MPLFLAACLTLVASTTPLPAPQGLAEARRGFRTRLTEQRREARPLQAPPPELFTLVRHAAP